MADGIEWRHQGKVEFLTFSKLKELKIKLDRLVQSAEDGAWRVVAVLDVLASEFV